MKFRVTMKSPDHLDEAIDEKVQEYLDRASIASEETNCPLSEDELEEIGESRRREMRSAAEPWFLWGELLTVEIDTETGGCTVVKP